MIAILLPAGGVAAGGLQVRARIGGEIQTSVQAGGSTSPRRRASVFGSRIRRPLASLKTKTLPRRWREMPGLSSLA